MKKVIVPASSGGNMPPLLIMRPAEGSSVGQGGSPSQLLVLKPVNPAGSPAKSSVVQLETPTVPAVPPGILPGVQLVNSADGKKLVLTNVVSPPKTSPAVGGKQMILMPRSDVATAARTSPTTTAAVLSGAAGKPAVMPVMSSNVPRTVVVNPTTSPVSPHGNSVTSLVRQPIVLQVPGLNQPIVVKQCVAESSESVTAKLPSLISQMIPTSSNSSSSSSPNNSSTTVPSSASVTKGTNPVMYLKSGSATYKVVGKPVPVKLFPKNAPSAVGTPAVIPNIPVLCTKKLPLPPLRKPDEVETVKVASPTKSSALPMTRPPAYLNIRVKEEFKTCKEEVDDVRVKEEAGVTKQDPEDVPETSQSIDSMLDVRIKEEPKEDQTGELLARDEQLRKVLGVTGNISVSQSSKFYIRTSEGTLVTISPQEAEALGLDLQDKVENNQKKLQNAIHSFKASAAHKILGEDSVVQMQDGNILIPDNVDVKDFVSRHVSPAAELNASIMKSIGSKRLDMVTESLLAPKSNAAIVEEFVEPDTERRFLRVQVETETHGKDVCDVEVTPLNHYRCPFCIRDFKTKDHIVSHLRIHTGERPYPCEVCGKRYRQRIDIIRHMRIHTGEKPFTCGLCNASFNQKSNLRSHMRIHTGERPVQCKVCGKDFSRNTHLKQHMKLHTGEKPFQCKVCFRPFRFKSGLHAHERIHSGIKPYACSLCGRTFTQIVGLLRHERTHVGEKPFRCQSCGKSFNNRENLKVHVIKHTSERPFECDLCERSFTDRPALRCHRKKYHCNNLLCVICLRGDFKDRIELREHLRAHERENWEETPEGDLVPLVRDFNSHFISVDDTLENLDESDESEGEPISQGKTKAGLGANDVPAENNDISQGGGGGDGDDDDGDSEYEEHEINIESSDPLA